VGNDNTDPNAAWREKAMREEKGITLWKKLAQTWGITTPELVMFPVLERECRRKLAGFKICPMTSVEFGDRIV
jgi:hypothetical protein